MRLSNAQLFWDTNKRSIHRTNDDYNHDTSPLERFKYN